MAVTDLVMVALFIWAFFQPGIKKLKYVVLAAIGLSILNVLVWTPSVPAEAIYQGFRKSILWILAIIIGYSIPRQKRNIVVWIIAASCTFVCAYAINQWINGYSAFDYRLLQAQSASEYANRIGTYQRAISVLSSGFHVGMTGSLLIIIALCLKQRSGISATLITLSLCLVGALGVYASYTRTFMIVAGLLATIQIFRSSRHPIARIGLFTVAAASFTYGIFGEYFSAFQAAAFSDQRFTSRSFSYEQMASIAASNPLGLLTGYGLGSAGSTLGPQFSLGNAIWVEPHNAVLKYVIEFGIPLSLLLFWHIGKAVFASRNSPKLAFDHAASPLAVLLLIASGMTITSVETWPISLYVGFIVGMFASTRENASEQGRT